MKDQSDVSSSRRGFLKLVTITLGVGVAAPFLSSCANNKEKEFQVNIVVQQSEIHYFPATLTVPRGSTVTWLNKSYYSQSATCDPKQAKNGSAASLPQGVQPWDSGLLYPGQRFSKLFNVPGTYVYFSLPQLSPNTVGTIIVK